MATYVSHTITQPYYIYVQYLKYNVVPGVITLTFDSPPSQFAEDYIATAIGGSLDAQFTFGFSPVGNTLSFSGDTVSLTMPVVMENNCYIQISYRGTELPFRIKAKEDYRYVLPAIFETVAYNF